MIDVTFSTLVSLAGFWVLYWLYQDYRDDWVRQRLFGVRDRLFDLARDGHISFDHRAYGLLRTTMNGYIRFAHRVRFGTILLMYFSLRKIELRIFGERTFPAAFERAVQGLPKEVVARLTGIRDEMHALVGRHLVFSSVLLLALVGVLALVGIVLKNLWTGFVGLARLLNVIDLAALSAGEPQEAPPSLLRPA